MMIAHDDDNPFFDLAFLLMMLALAIFALCSCAPPTVEEFLGDGVNCKAAITMPDEEPERGETVTVAVRIYDCKEVK